MNTVAFDPNLNPVIDAASNDELDVLHALIKTKLSETLSIQEAYKKHYPDHQKYADLIAREIRDFGGNSVANVVRGKGPAYHDIVCDVAKALIQIAGPTYKVTIPSVAYVAMLRKAQGILRCTKCEAVVDGGFRFCPACGERIGTAP